MKNKNFKIISILFLSFILIFSGVIHPAAASTSLDTRQEPKNLPPAAPAAGGTTIFLPSVIKNTSSAISLPDVLIGSESCCTNDQSVADKASNANMTLMRVDALDWKRIEPNRTNPATYDWSSVNKEMLKNLALRKINVIGTVRYAPSWAQKYPPYSCGPILESAFDAFAQFLAEAVKIYSKPPYSVMYWELGNEIDAGAFAGIPDSVFGCWGGWDSDPYYGGSYYVKMLEKAYPAIKAANPDAQVLVGGFLLDCDPTNPPPGKTCTPGKFLEGILVNNGKYNGANYFDMISFHAYTFYQSDGTIVDENNPSWAHRGGVVLGKVDFLKSVLDKYNAKKVILQTEGALVCTICDASGYDFTNFNETQADYVVWLYIRNWAAGVSGTIWYAFEGPGWRYSTLLDGYQQPKPAYYALKYLTTKLKGVNFSQQIYLYPEIRAYEFKTSTKRIWVMWAPDQKPHSITLPAGVTQVTDKYGNVISPAGNQITVNRPIYVDLIP